MTSISQSTSSLALNPLASLMLMLAAMPASSEVPDYTQMPLSELVKLDVYAPSVFSSHIHAKGDWMIGHQYMNMSMQGSRNGTDRISDQDVLQGFMVTPTSMSMDMHMLHVMYAPSDNITLMAMIPYFDKAMEHLTRAGGTFQTRSSGLGDANISANHVLSEWEAQNAVHEFALTYGVSVPVGSIDEEDFLPLNMASARLPYPMQLGSGTYDLLTGALYLAYGTRYYWGTQIVATIRTGENDNGYRLGNRVELKAWAGKAWTDSVSTFIQLDYSQTRNIRGADPTLNPTMVSTADPDRRARTSMNLHLGFDFHLGQSSADGHTISFEWIQPTYQDLDGPQLETDETARVGWQVVF